MQIRTINKTASKILDTLTQGLELGQARKIGEDGGAIMAVHVDRLSERLYGVAHYYEQNGDRVPDPSMVFYNNGEGTWLPVSIQQWSGTTEAIRLDDNGKPKSYSAVNLADLCSFTSVWMRNIKAQQDLKNIPAPRN